MSAELYKWLKEVNLNYQELSKIDDNKWVLVNSNTLYYLFSLYQRTSSNKMVNKSLHIIQQHFNDLEILRYYGIDETSELLLYHHMPVIDAKTIFKHWEKEEEICSRPLVVLKDVDNNIPFPPSKLPKLRKAYLQAKKKEQEWENHQKELKYRIEKGYMV